MNVNNAAGYDVLLRSKLIPSGIVERSQDGVLSSPKAMDGFTVLHRRFLIPSKLTTVTDEPKG